MSLYPPPAEVPTEIFARLPDSFRKRGRSILAARLPVAGRAMYSHA